MKFFRRKYRVGSTRLAGWDYSSVGWYYVTLCTKNRVCILGDIVDGTIRLSAIGEIVAHEWQKTEGIRPHVSLDEWVIMPNHLHAIIAIKDTEKTVETPRWGVSKADQVTLKSDSIGSIMGQFKSNCTKRIRAAGFRDFAWQPRFYDHIIRNEESLSEMREYIAGNPMKWELDRNNPMNFRG